MMVILEVVSRYSQLCRIMGVVIATVSAFFACVMMVAIAQYGYVLVNQQPSTDLYAICKAICAPLFGVAVGLGLLFVFNE